MWALGYDGSLPGLWNAIENQFLITGVKNDEASVSSFKLLQNYPNPFNPATTISYYIKEGSFVSLKIFDLLGREDAVLVNEYKSAGKYNMKWNAADYPSGIYFYQITAGTFSEVKKMMLLK